MIEADGWWRLLHGCPVHLPGDMPIPAHWLIIEQMQLFLWNGDYLMDRLAEARWRGSLFG